MKTALITGASSGIGAAFAEELARRHTNLVLVARSEAKLQQLAHRLQSQFAITVTVIVQDLTLPAATAGIFETITHQGLTIDLLINNAGFGLYGEFTSKPRPRQTEMIQLNVLALVELTHLFLPGMRQRRSGGILNIASLAAFQPLPYMAVYAATKAFVLSFSEALWAENREFGVHILAVCPGPTDTAFSQVAEYPPSFAQNFGQPRSSSQAVVQEALAAWEAGQSTVVTGGLTNQLIVNLPRFLPRDALVSAVEKQFRNEAR